MPTVVLDTADELQTSDTTPTLQFTGTDENGDALRYQIQIDDEPFVIDFPLAGTNFPLLDDFNRANQDPPNITGWTSTGTAVGIRNNAMEGLADDVGWITLNTDFNQDQAFTYEVPVRCTTDWGCGAFTRWDPATGNGYFFQLIRQAARPNELRIRIFIFTAWAFAAELTSAPYVYCDFADGDTLGVRSVGNNHQFWHKPVGSNTWTKYVDVNDGGSTYLRGGRLSMIIEGLELRVDNVRGANL